MQDIASLRTSATLLGRLRLEPTDAEAWAEFVDRYGPLIRVWCRRWGLQDADADDVTQIVLTKLAQRLRSFEYDPARSFRGWLKTVAHHAWRDFVDSRQRGGQGSGDTDVHKRLETIEAREDLMRELELEIERALLEEAMEQVKPRVSPATWQAFYALAFTERPAREVAAELNITITAAYMAKSRVRTMLREELARLRGSGTDE